MVSSLPLYDKITALYICIWWLNQVYDVTPYVEEHPGGDAILNNAGADSTEGFFGFVASLFFTPHSILCHAIRDLFNCYSILLMIFTCYVFWKQIVCIGFY
jgi:hypothetical protein